MKAEGTGQQQEENTADNDEVRPLVGEELEFAHAERGEREIEQRLEHVRPTQYCENQWDAQPNIVECDDDRAEYEIQDGDGEHSSFSSFSEEDEEVYPHPRPDHVRNADDHEVDYRVELNGAFHECRFL